MSRKNHEMIDGKLLQTDKKYAQLKLKQKEKIAEWMFQATRDYYMKKYTFPNDKHLEEVVDIVYEKIEDAEIWIPYGEVFKHYKSKRSDINKRIRRSLNEKEESRIEKVCSYICSINSTATDHAFQGSLFKTVYPALQTIVGFFKCTFIILSGSCNHINISE